MSPKAQAINENNEVGLKDMNNGNVIAPEGPDSTSLEEESNVRESKEWFVWLKEPNKSYDILLKQWTFVSPKIVTYFISRVADTISLWFAKMALTSSLLIESPEICGWPPVWGCDGATPPA